MPVNTTSTGASYGKSSDPLCPLGFHPQVRWPTRCKRCFRDYKEHSDDNDRARFNHTSSNQDNSSWANGQRPGFNKSRSLDVNFDNPRVTVPEVAVPDDGKDIPNSTPDSEGQGAAANFGRFFEPPKPRSFGTEFQGLPKVNTERLRAQSEAPAPRPPHRLLVKQPSTDTALTPPERTPRSRTPNRDEIIALKKELEILKEENERLLKEQLQKPVSFEATKASETAFELKKARERLQESEAAMRSLEKDRKSLHLKIKDMESRLDSQPNSSDAQKLVREYETKLKFLEKKCKTLEAENDKLQNNVQNLEGELEEVQDNFREDEADEYRHLKRDLETASKNCRVLQFKLKKAEKNMSEINAEKTDLETKLKQMSGGTGVLENMNKIRKLEQELAKKTQMLQKYELQLSEIRLGRQKVGPTLTKTGSVERSSEDQLLKDLQDSIERENDLKEQMSIAEEDAADLRVKVSRLEDENESLMTQLKKMSSKNKRTSRRSPSPFGAGAKESDNRLSVDAIGEEPDSPTSSEEDLRLQLEVSENETAVLRKKVDGLLTDNLKMTKEIKELGNQLKTAKTKVQPSSWRTSSSSSSESEQLEEVQSELNNTRIRLIEKERECEGLEAQLRSSKLNKFSKSKSLEGTDRMRLEVIEKEAEVLRQRNAELEAENESLCQKNPGKKLPSMSLEKFQADKKSLEEKIRLLEAEVKDKQRVIDNLRNSSLDPSNSKRPDNLEVARLKREKSSLEQDLERMKRGQESERVKIQKLEQDMTNESGKVERAKKDLLDTQRDLKTLEGENQQLNNEIAKLQSEVKSLIKDRERLAKDCDSLKSKNSSNLQQTQDGIRAFKDQIEALKKDLHEERSKGKRSRGSAKEVETLESKVKELEEKWAKSKRINQQRKEKIEVLEKQISDITSDESNSMIQLKGAQRTIDNLERKVQDLEEKLEEAEESQTNPDKLQQDYNNLKRDHATIQAELATLRQTYNMKADEWIREKLEIQRRVNDLEESLRKTAGEGWESERERFKQIIEDRDAQITQLKIEGDVARSQASNLRKEVEDVRLKLADYEKMSKFQKVVSSESDESNQLKEEIDHLKKQLSVEKKDKKSEINLMKMRYDSKIALLSEEMTLLKSQCSKYRRERDTYKEMVDGVQKNRSGATSKPTTDKERLSELQIQMQVLEDDLSEAKLETSKAKAKQIETQAKYEIEIAELKSKINELEEEALIDSGRARIAGTRTKMELAWQKERESQKKLINELNTMARDLKATLIEVEREKERERLDSKRKAEAARVAAESEISDARKQVTDLQYDLLELRDAHAKLRTTNEKLKRDQERAEKERSEIKTMLKERSRSEQGEEKKVHRLLLDIDAFIKVAKKIVEDESKSKALAGPLNKLKESKEELEQFRKLLEDERNAKKASLMLRGGSADTEGSGESPGSGLNSSRWRNSTALTTQQQRRHAYRKTASFGEGAGGDQHDLWKSQESHNGGSTTSLASNSSIPLPIPVRTSNRDLTSTDNFTSIRRLERDASLDRISTGSRESNRSTQSDLVGGKRKSGLINKLKKLTRGLSAERDNSDHFGSGSDISSASARKPSSTVTSRPSRPSRPEQSRNGSRPTSRNSSLNRKTSNTTTSTSTSAVAARKALFDKTSNPNEPYDKLFNSASQR